MSAPHPHSESEQNRNLRRFADEIAGTASREWPQGRISGDDDGVTAFAIAADPKNKIVRIQFSKPMLWLGLPVAEAKQLVQILGAKIKELE